MARKRRYDNELLTDRSGVGYSQPALDALKAGNYGKQTNRKAQYNTSQEQAQQAKELPVLKGVSIPTNTTNDFESSFSRKNYVDTDNARRKYAERIEYKPLGQEDQFRNDDSYVVKRDRYDKLMKNGRLANDIKTLAEVNYNNWDQDATIMPEFAETMGAKAITGGYTKDQFINTLSRRYDLTPAELNDMALTFHADANKQEVENYGKQLEKLGKEHEVIGSLGSFAGTLGNSIEGGYNALVGTLTNDDRFLSNMFSTTKNSPREGVKQNIDSEVGKTAYDLLMGVGDMAVGAAAGSAPAIMAGNTANDAMSSAMERGSGTRRSAIYGTAAGAADYITEALGLGNAEKLAVDSIKKTGIKQFLKNTAKAGLGEAKENVIQDLVQSALDAIINGGNAELAKSFEDRKASGQSDSDALGGVVWDYLGQLAGSGALGFTMGSAMQTGKTVLPKVPELIHNYVEKNQRLGLVPDEFGWDSASDTGKVPELEAKNTPKASEVADAIRNGEIVEPDGFVPPSYQVSKGVDSIPAEEHKSIYQKSGKNTIINDGTNYRQFIDNILENPSKPTNDSFYFGKVSSELGEDLNRSLGEDFTGNHILIDESHILHMIEKHGENSKGAKNGEIPITPDDIESALEAFNKPDMCYWVDDNSIGQRQFKVQKRIDGYIYTVFAVKNGNKTKGDIQINDMYKSPTALNNGYDPSLNLTSESGQSLDSTTNVPPTGGNVNGDVPPNDGDRVRSFSKRGSNDETLPDEIRNTLSEDYYKVVHNVDTEARANDLFDPNDLIQTRSNLDRAVEAHDPASALLSYKLAKAYVDNGNYDAATDVLQNVSAELTRMGQFTQAAKLAMLQNDPMAAMRSYMRDLEKLNEWGKKKYKGKWNNLELSEDDINLINSVQKGDSDGLNNVIDQLNAKFSKQIPADWWDKAVTASKTAMLLNPRTQSRNILANMATLPIRSAADRVSAVGQNIVHLINPETKVTQSVTGGTKEQKSIAKQIWEQRKDSILGENKMKDSVKSDILSQRQIFNDDFLAKWIDNATNGGIQKLNEKLGANGNQSTMETLTNFTYWLMGDVGDTPFVKKNFVNRLASYMKAQGINNIEDVPDDAIAIATQEALKATFKDDNAFTKALQGIKQKSGKFGEVALPFVKTPANLTMRAIDYSPAGLINTFRKIRSGAEANAVIDELSKNLTGSAMIYLGYKLAEKGLLSGSYSKDADEAAWQKQQGFLENAIHVPEGVPLIGDKYVTYDWTQPAATPLVLGQTIYEAVKASDNENADILDIINATYKGGLKTANTIINSSPLQSLSDLLGDSPYSDEGVAENIANEILEFPQRFIPSILGATARTIDPTMRDTYVKDSTLTGTIGNQVRSAMAKVPGLSKTLPAAYDTWGNERTRSDSTGQAFLAQMVNPGQFGNKNETPLDAEIQRIFDATGNNAVFPLYAPRSLDLGNDGNITLTNKQHSEYQKTMGQRSYSYAESIMKNPEYKNLSDDDKAKVLEKAYKLSNSLTKEDMFGHVTDSDKELKEIARKGNPDDVAKYLVDGVFQKAEKDAKAAQNEAIKSATGLSASSNAAKMIKADMDAGNTQAAEQKIDEATQLSNLGLTKPGPTETYYKAKNSVPDLTVDAFAKQYKEIDTDGNQGIKQDELIDYFNRMHYTDESEALKTWNIFAPNGKKVPYLKKDGTWGKH